MRIEPPDLLKNGIDLKALPSEEIDILLKFFPQGVVALDLETTGLSPLVDRIIEISALKITPSGVEVFDQLIQPEIPIPAYTIDIHHITDEMVCDSPLISEIIPKFADFIGGHPLIAHNAKFDIGFIVYDLLQNKLSLPKTKVYCSCALSRKVFIHSPNHRLGTLVEELGITLENHHRALDDANACLRVFAKALINYFERKKNTKILQSAFLFEVNSFDKDAELKIPKHLKDLENVVAQQEMVDIKYSGGSMKGQFRPIKPTSLLPMPDGLILYAQCLVSDLYKSFAVKKIAEVRRLSPEEKEVRLKKYPKNLNR